MRASWRTQPSTAAVLGNAFVPEIESLRGIAITLVFLLHLSGSLNFGHPALTVVSPLGAFAVGGHTGVSLFFVLSGFLLGRPFLLEAMYGKRLSRPAYYARRALRILPAYFVAVIVATTLNANRPSDLLHGIPYLFFLNSFAGIGVPLRPYSDVWWSLATEVQFYLLLPLLPAFLRSRTGRWCGLILAVAYAVAYRAFATGALHASTVEDQVKLAHSLFGRAPQFAVGIFAAWVCERFGAPIHRWASARRWVRAGAGDAVALVLLGGLSEMLRRIVFVTYWQAEARWPAWHVAEGALWGAILVVLLLVPLWIRPLCCNRVWSTLGQLSYSIYLIHAALIPLALGTMNRIRPGVFVGWNLRALPAALMVSALCVGVSTVTYLLIERPFLRRKGRLSWWALAPAAQSASGQVAATIAPNQVA